MRTDMKLFVQSTLSVSDSGLKKSLVLLLFLSIFLSEKTYSQTACSIGQAQIEIHCPTQSMVMGIGTVTGATFTWYKDGVRLAGPLPGDGNPTSFGFALRTTDDAGHYTVERTQGSTVTCEFNKIVQVISLPAAQTLTGGGPLCNGEKILSLVSSESNVTYNLLRTGDVYWAGIQGTGTGPLNFPPVYNPGVYSVSASKESDCSGVYSYFGNVIVTGDPDRATINYTTTNSANISWAGSGNFIVEYGLQGFTPGTGVGAGAGGAVISASSSPVNINGLASGFTYDVYIRQLCSSPNYISSQARSFTTNCSPITTFPYTQGFETTSGSALPACWKAINNNDDAYQWETNNFYPRTGARHAQLVTDQDVAKHDDYLFLPPVTLTGNQRLKFWAESAGLSLPQVYQVKLSTTNNSLSNFTNILLTDTVKSGIYEEKIINLTTFSGLVYIAIHVPPGTSMNNYLYLDDFTIENIPACQGPSFVKVNGATNNSVSVSWKGGGTFIAEYGTPGFIPGTGATAGGGTVISSAVSPLTISGLSQSTSYDVYIRQNCSSNGNGYSSNSAKNNFTTFFACSPTVISSACSSVTATIPIGTGVVNFGGVYPINSAGALQTPGRELLYSFTPAITGVYYLDVTATTPGFGITYLYKAASAGCGNTGWTGITYTSSVKKFPIGLLQSGTQYYFILDNPSTATAKTQTFRICLATVATPPTVNSCIVIDSSLNIPAYSPKPEYIIDNAGNLIGRFDFSSVSNNVGSIKLSYYLNSGSLRHDNYNREFLDRNFVALTTYPPANPVNVTFYFKNTELQNLINDPDDGLADVNSVSDIGITRDPAGVCGSVNSGVNMSYIPQTSSGSYDANSKYVQFSTPDFSSFYLHGGSDPLFSTIVLCPGDNTSLSMNPPGDGYIYQWQVDMGSGFVNIIPGDFFKDINTPTLTINFPPTTYAGYKYRCVATNGSSVITTDAKILRFAMTWTGTETNVWEDPRNWSCDVFGKNCIPDANVDVIIPNITRKPIVNSNVSCRSVVTKPGATLTVNSGFKLTVTGH